MRQLSEFKDDLFSWLLYCTTLDAASAQFGFKASLAHEAWPEHCGHWFALATQLEARGDWPALDWMSALAEKLMSLKVDKPACRELLPQLSDRMARKFTASEPLIQRVVGWFTSKADAGEAHVAAEMLKLAATTIGVDDAKRPDTLPRAYLPLVDWLLANGAAELRLAIHHDLAFRLVEAAVAYGDDNARIVNALRFAIQHRRVAPAWTWQRPLGAWPAVEVSLNAGESDDIVSALLLASVDSLRSAGAEALFRPLVQDDKTLRLSRRAIVHALANAELPERMIVEGWPLAFWHPPSEFDVRFASADLLGTAIECLQSVSHRNTPVAGQGESPPDSPQALLDNPEAGLWSHLEDWAALLTQEWIRLRRGTRHSFWQQPSTDLLDQLAGSIQLWRGARRALRDFAVGQANALAQDMLSEENPSLGHSTWAASRLLFPIFKPSKADKKSINLERYREFLDTFVKHSWPSEPIAGFDAAKLFHGVHRVEIDALPDDLKIHIGDGVVTLDDDYLRDLAAQGYSEELLGLASLYFLHELVHVAQGAQKIESVRAIRSTGGETTLMHLDLAADWAAVRMAALAVPRWEILWLRELQTRSIGDFPVSRYHGAASKYRKVNRMVGCRLDYIFRKLGMEAHANLGDGYVFAEYGPNGGTFLVMSSGPPMRLLLSSELSANDAKSLASCLDAKIDPRKALAAMDSMFINMLRRAQYKASLM
ncbi:MAG: hypothetical protein KF696_01220 [Planctomycetes bacterium]|nr:hypothetical protein [Planctomycetota bacterium]MCW8134440.1 hypothetical protein [Planctomycetota bacterium]